MYSIVLVTALATATATPSWCHRCYGCYSGGYSYCHGCYGYSCGGCYGFSGYGCAGACYGYHGGCYSAFGNQPLVVYGNGCYGCNGCYGGCNGFVAPVPRTHMVDPFPPINPEAIKDPKEEKVPAPKLKDKPDEQSRARLHIEVPAGGKLYVDGRLINVAPGKRVFQTPALAAGEAYYYDVRIEVDSRTEERRVIIRRGDDTIVSFSKLGAPSLATR